MVGPAIRLARPESGHPLVSIEDSDAFLKVIFGSPTDLEPMLHSVVDSATRLCEAFDVSIFQVYMKTLTVNSYVGCHCVGPTGLCSDRIIGLINRGDIAIHNQDTAPGCQ